MPRTQNRPRTIDRPSPIATALAERDRDIVGLVEDAIQRKDVILAYQPVVQARKPKSVAFFEGLIRLLDRNGRVIPAKDFITDIEPRELGRDLDCLALELGLRALRDAPKLRLSINLSARSMGYTAWMGVLKSALKTDPTIGERLILEVTEHSAMGVPDLVTSFMRQLQPHGIGFALDDFGSGVTSFRYLRDFYFDILKIDGQFVRGVSDRPDNQILVQAMIAVARQFDMFTVAEQVETAQDAAFLRAIGVDCLQGFHFAGPATSPPWLKRRASKRRQIA